MFKSKDGERRADNERRLVQLADKLRGQDLEVDTEVAEGFSAQRFCQWQSSATPGWCW